MEEYKYNLFLSWTGADRALKRQIHDYFTSRNGEGYCCYDSDCDCKSGDFRENYMAALRASKVYLLLLTDNLFKRADEYISEVINEFNGALDAEARRRLNIVVLCTSDIYRRFDPYVDRIEDGDLRLKFFNGLVAHSVLFRETQSDGLLSEELLEEIYGEVTRLVAARDDGKPELPNRMRLDVESISPRADVSFYGRDVEENAIRAAFDERKQIVVLRGLGGMGKTTVANRFAQIVSREKFLYYVQTVNVGEVPSDDFDCLKQIAVKTSFSSRVNEELSRMVSEEERISRRINLLKQLPENCLLVVDNLNNLNEQSLNLLHTLPCRLLITTRANIKTDDNRVSVQEVGSLVDGDAKSLFTERSNRSVTDEQFRLIWEAARKHTMTLCIMAGILRSRTSMTVEQLVERFGESLDVDTAVNFEHNDEIRYEDLMGHLTALFKISELNDTSKAILRNLSILNDGTIAVDDLVRFLRLPNDNDVYRLIHTGWLYLQETTGVCYVILPPIVAEVMLRLLPPDCENVRSMTEYLCDVTANRKDNLLYSGVQVLQEKLFYATVTIAKHCGRLCMPLWNAFEEVFHLIGDLDELDKKENMLLSYLTDEQDANAVKLYCDAVTLHINPENVDRLESQAKLYRLDSASYRDFIRAIGVAGQYVSDEKDLKKLNELSAVALSAAIEDGNDVAVMVSLANTNKRYYSPREVNRYVLQRRKDGAARGTLYMIQYLNKINSIFGDAAGFVKWVNLREFDLDNYVRKVLKRPSFALFSVKMYSQLRKLPPSDPFYTYFDSIFSCSEKLVETSVMSVGDLLQGVKSVYQMIRDDGLTLLSPSQIVDNLIKTLKMFPRYMQGELKAFASEPISSDASEMTLDDIANLTTSYSVSEYLAEVTEGSEKIMYRQQAIRKAAMIYRLQSELNSPNDYRAVEALIMLANCCLKFDQRQKAMTLFYTAYVKLKALRQDGANVEKRLLDLCHTILSAHCFIGPNEKVIETKYYKDVLNDVLEMENCVENKIDAVVEFIRGTILSGFAVIEQLRNEFVMGGLKKLFELLPDAGRVAPKRQREISFELFNLRYLLYCHHVDIGDLNARFVKFFHDMRRCASGMTGNFAAIFEQATLGLSDANFTEGSAHLVKAVKLCIKYDNNYWLGALLGCAVNRALNSAPNRDAEIAASRLFKSRDDITFCAEALRVIGEGKTIIETANTIHQTAFDEGIVKRLRKAKGTTGKRYVAYVRGVLSKAVAEANATTYFA